MQTHTIERRPSLSSRDKVLVFGSTLIAWLCLMGTIIPGFGMLGARMPLWLYVTLCAGILLFTFAILNGDLHPRSGLLLKDWRDRNPELFLRLMEVVDQAAKDINGIGFFNCALTLIEKDPDRAPLLEGLYFWTQNKAQLMGALCRKRWDGMNPAQVWELDVRLRVAIFTDLRDLFRNIYIVATVGYLGVILTILFWSRVKALFLSIASNPQGQSWLLTFVAPATLIGCITVYLTWSKNRANLET